MESQRRRGVVGLDDVDGLCSVNIGAGWGFKIDSMQAIRRMLSVFIFVYDLKRSWGAAASIDSSHFSSGRAVCMTVSMAHRMYGERRQSWLRSPPQKVLNFVAAFWRAMIAWFEVDETQVGTEPWRDAGSATLTAPVRHNPCKIGGTWSSDQPPDCQGWRFQVVNVAKSAATIGLRAEKFKIVNGVRVIYLMWHVSITPGLKACKSLQKLATARFGRVWIAAWQQIWNLNCTAVRGRFTQIGSCQII